MQWLYHINQYKTSIFEQFPSFLMHSLDYSRYYVLAMNILRFFKVVIFDAVCHIETLASSTTILNIITVLIYLLTFQPKLLYKIVRRNVSHILNPFATTKANQI